MPQVGCGLETGTRQHGEPLLKLARNVIFFLILTQSNQSSDDNKLPSTTCRPSETPWRQIIVRSATRSYTRLSKSGRLLMLPSNSIPRPATSPLLKKYATLSRTLHPTTLIMQRTFCQRFSGRRWPGKGCEGKDAPRSPSEMVLDTCGRVGCVCGWRCC